MSLAGAFLMILTGLVVMAFGLFLFYAWLPLLYGLVGFDIGILLGRSITGDIGTLSIVFGIILAIILGAASYFLEPYRRILLGVSAGFLFGLAVASALDLEVVLGGFFGRMLAFVCAIIGGLLVPRYFDLFIIGSSAVSGAAIAMTGAHALLPDVGLFDLASGNLLPALLAVVLALTGIGWQFSNIKTWGQSLPPNGEGKRSLGD